jgi:UDP-N-acetylmuramyl pentapeptide phosphotransferase/UDP-N-acetylglucosamine-1-phosphate transferase
MPAYLLIGLVVAFGAGVLLVFTKHWHGRFSLDHTHGVQKFHTKPTPRIGGVAVASGLVATWAWAPYDVNTLLGPMLLAGVPAFVAGVAEDVTKRVGVAARLLATMFSGLVAWWLTGIALNRVDIPLLDDVVAWAPVAVAFTAFAVAGVANAVNIIDGFNGLSSGTVLILLTALGLIAQGQGDPTLALACASVGVAVGGFWLVNFPLGKIFLGDGGAYLSGFCLGWLAVLLLMRHPDVSTWLVLLACAYPVTEVLYSVWRRHRARLPSGAPDNLHLHSLIKTQVVMRRVPHWKPRLRNAAVSPLMWMFAAVPAALAVVLQDASAWACVLALAGCVLWYHLSYQALARRQQAHPLPDSSVMPLTPEAPTNTPAHPTRRS